MKPKYLLLAILLLVLMIQPVTAQTNDPFIDDLAQRTYTYLSSDWATNNHLPWSWRAETMTGGDYANTTEIGLLMLSHLGAYEMQRAWSPDWATVESEILAILDQLRAWQTGSQTSQPNGANAYNNSVFYQWYWISWNPPVVGASGDTHLVASIDNAFLATSLITIRAYAQEHGHGDIASKASAILADMDFTLWYDTGTHRFNWGDIENPKGGVWADYYSNENRIINFVARAMGQLSTEEYRLSLEALTQNPGIYDRGTSYTSDDVVVNRVAWDGSYFTYMAPGLFVREMDTPYAQGTLIPATWAQITYASDSGYDGWGLSDCYDVNQGGYVQQGSLPAPSNAPESRPGLVSPHASAMALVTPYVDQAISNLKYMSSLPSAYHSEYGFYDSVNLLPSSTDYQAVSERFSSLNQEWLFLSIVNVETDFIHDYFYRDSGVQSAHSELESWLNETSAIQNGGLDADATLKEGSVTDYKAKGIPWVFTGKGTKVKCDKDVDGSGIIGDSDADKILSNSGHCAAQIKSGGKIKQTINVTGKIQADDLIYLTFYTRIPKATASQFQAIILGKTSTDYNNDGIADKQKEKFSLSPLGTVYTPFTLVMNALFPPEKLKVQVKTHTVPKLNLDDVSLTIDSSTGLSLIPLPSN